MQSAKALARLCRWAGSPAPSLVAYVISTIISYAGSFLYCYRMRLLPKSPFLCLFMVFFQVFCPNHYATVCHYIALFLWQLQNRYVASWLQMKHVFMMHHCTVFCHRGLCSAPLMQLPPEIILSRLMTKPTKWPVRPAKPQISLGIRPVWSESLLFAHWVAEDPCFLHADSKDFDQTGRMPRQIWVFAGCTCHFVRFVMRQLIYVSVYNAWLCMKETFFINSSSSLSPFSISI